MPCTDNTRLFYDLFMCMTKMGKCDKCTFYPFRAGKTCKKKLLEQSIEEIKSELLRINKDGV